MHTHAGAAADALSTAEAALVEHTLDPSVRRRRARDGRVRGEKVRVQLLSRDRYGRAVAAVSYGGGLRPRDLSEDLLAEGLAVVYRGAGAQYDGPIARWDRLEADAKRRSRGIWADPTYRKGLRN